MQEATVLDGIGFTVPDSGESRLGRVPAQPARLRFSRKSSACTARGFLDTRSCYAAALIGASAANHSRLV